MLMKRAIVWGLLAAGAMPAYADVIVTDADSVAARSAATRAARAAKPNDKPGVRLSETGEPRATGSLALTDQSGLEYFINTNITFATTSSASGAASEASFAAAVGATTMGGDTVQSTLNDAFDGYGSLCISVDGATGPCSTGGGKAVQGGTVTMYNETGAAPTLECGGRQAVFPNQTIGGLTVSRKVYVPTDDVFMRHLDIVTNPTAAPITVNVISSNNLGSDANTVVVTTSSGDAAATTADNWVTTFQNFSGNTSSDPRLAHVLSGPGGAIGVSNISFVDGDDNPFWTYTSTVPAGATQAFLHFVSGHPSRPAAATQAARLTGLPATAVNCLTATELGQVQNFFAGTPPDVSIVKTGPATAGVGQPISYTLTVTTANAGAGTVTVTDTLPAGVTFVSATGTGWTCAEAAGTVTCTAPSLAVGTAPAITINVTAPAAAATLTNTATVATAGDSNPANNSSSVNTVVAAAPSDVTITKTGPATIAAGANFDYTLSVSVTGAAATAVTVTDTLPAGVTFVSAAGTGWTCTQAAGVVTCTAATLPAGTAPPITITVTAPATAASLSNTANVTAQGDANTGNNASTATTTVTGGGGGPTDTTPVPGLSPAGIIALMLSLGLVVVLLRRRLAPASK